MSPVVTDPATRGSAAPDTLVPGPVTAAPLRLGTRRSALARTQSSLVAARLHEVTGREVVLVEVITEGDVSTESLSTIGGTGVFASALRGALRRGEVDLAVHSLKDLPTAPEPGLVIAAVPPREDPRDVLVAAGGAGVAELRDGATVGTGSPRRAAQLRVVRPDLDVVDVRGNVDTRLRMVHDGRLDAVVLARSGLLRLGRADEATEVIDPDVVLPAPGQGALAVECREDDLVTAAACALLDDPRSRAEVTAERALLAALEAGCTAPVGALARSGPDGSLHLVALAASPDGTRTVRRSGTSPAADPVPPAGAGVVADPGAAALDAARELGRGVARAMLDDGAAALTAPPRADAPDPLVAPAPPGADRTTTPGATAPDPAAPGTALPAGATPRAADAPPSGHPQTPPPMQQDAAARALSERRHL